MKVLAVLYKGGVHAEEEPRLLGTIENSLGIKEFLEEQGHTYKVVFDKEGPNSEFQKEIVDADILITTPFHPGYATREVIEKAKNLKACITAGVGSDHIDLNAANERKILVAEVTGSNVVSVAEHVVMTILILITTPFHPGYATREVIEKAKNLKACITAGVGSDHIDLNAANERKILVAEVTGSNVVSVAEHVVMTILILVRNYTPAHEQIMAGGWDVAGVAKNAFDLENKVIGTLGAGRIGFRVLQRLKPFQPKELLYYDYQSLPAHAEKEVDARRVEDLKEFLSQVDVLTINAPLHEGTKHLINKEKISWMKDGAWIVNTARGAICVAEDVAEAVKSGKLRGYGGDVWEQQPSLANHPWRHMQYGTDPKGGNAMVAHYSGTTLDAQIRYANGVKDILKRFFAGEEQEQVNVICIDGDYASKAYGEREKMKKK